MPIDAPFFPIPVAFISIILGLEAVLMGNPESKRHFFMSVYYRFRRKLDLIRQHGPS